MSGSRAFLQPPYGGAVSEGFEPPAAFRQQRFIRPSPSATRSTRAPGRIRTCGHPLPEGTFEKMRSGRGRLCPLSYRGYSVIKLSNVSTRGPESTGSRSILPGEPLARCPDQHLRRHVLVDHVGEVLAAFSEISHADRLAKVPRSLRLLGAALRFSPRLLLRRGGCRGGFLGRFPLPGQDALRRVRGDFGRLLRHNALRSLGLAAGVVGLDVLRRLRGRLGRLLGHWREPHFFGVGFAGGGGGGGGAGGRGAWFGRRHPLSS